MTALTVGSFNVRYWDDPGDGADWEVRLPVIVQTIRQSGAWIVGIQESRAVSGDLTQAKMIAQRLGPQWRSAQGGREAAVIWRQDRLLLSNTPQSFPLNPSRPATHYPNRVPRSAIYARFFDRWSGRQICFYSAHGPTENDAPAGSTFVEVTAEAGRTVANRCLNDVADSGPSASGIIVGDTNSAGTFWANVVVRGLVDTHAQVGQYRHYPLNSVNGWDPMMTDRQAGLVIDRIFVTPDLRVIESGLVVQFDAGASLPLASPLPSDHLMVSAAVEFTA